MELILWRHADAELPLTDDLSRALTERGRKQAARMAAWLTPRLPQTVTILVSPAKRCLQTAKALGRGVEVCDDLAPDRGVDALLAAAGWPGGVGTVLIVGHQPTLGQTARRLLTGDSVGEVSVRKAAVWWFQNRERLGEHQTLLRAVQDPDWL
jgi:phosphohistidine phosphatase